MTISSFVCFYHISNSFWGISHYLQIIYSAVRRSVTHIEWSSNPPHVYKITSKKYCTAQSGYCKYS